MGVGDGGGWEIPEGGFKNPQQIEIWESTQNYYIRQFVAARAALRIIPNFALLVDRKVRERQSTSVVILPSFRTIVASFVAGIWSDKFALFAAKDGVAAVARAAGAYARAYGIDTSKKGARHLAVSRAAAAGAGVARAVGMADVAAVSRAAAGAGGAAVFHNISLDAMSICKSSNGFRLSQKPIWLDSPPAILLENWQRLKTHLLTRDEDWQVWTDWYEARLRGDPLNKDLEIARVTELSKKDWEQGPKHVNAKIKAIIERFEKEEIKLPPQDPSAETFGLNEHGKITVTTATEGMQLEDTPEQKNWYGEFRAAVQELAAKSANQLGAVAGPITSLQEALPENIADAIIARVWSRANRLRVLLKRHDEALKNPDYAHEKLDPIIASDVEHITGLFSNLAIGDAGLRNAEEGAKGPQSESEIEEAYKIARPIIEDAIATGITDDLATEVLQGALPSSDDELQIQNDIMGRSVPERLQAVQNHKILSNFVAGLLEAGRKIRDGGLWAVGAGTVKFIGEHKDMLLEFAKQAWLNFESAIEKLFELLT